MKQKLYSLTMIAIAGLFMATSSNAQWTRNAATSSTFLTNANDNVGIGTNTPAFKLDVQSVGSASLNFKSSGGNSNIIIDRANSAATSGVNYRTAGVPTWQTGTIATDNFAIRNIALGSAAMVILATNSNVGIGTAAPAEKLSVAGNILATGNVSAGGNVNAAATVSGATITSTGNVNAVNFFGTGNLDVNGYVGFGSVEQLTDGGANTIASNSNFVPTSSCSRNLGTDALRWNDIFACGNLHVGTTTGVAAQLSVSNTTLGGIAGTGSFQIGETTASNLVMDGNEIQSRSNGVANTLFLQFNGGNIDANFGGGNAIFRGNVGINATSPAQRLHVRQDVANRAIEWQHESTADFWTVGIGTATLNCRFEFNGTGKGQISSVDGTYSTISDARLKEDVESIGNVLDKVMQLNPSQYYYTESKARAQHKSTGFIAQEVEKVFPQMIHNDDEGYKWLSYAEFSPIAIKAIQELNSKLETENSDLKQQIAEMRDCITSLCNASELKNSQTIQDASSPRLEQNQPNPFNQTSVIRFNCGDARQAQIIIRDLNGNLIKSINVVGKTQATINAYELAQGTYSYTLELDNRSVDTKLMVVTK